MALTQTDDIRRALEGLDLPTLFVTETLAQFYCSYFSLSNLAFNNFIKTFAFFCLNRFSVANFGPINFGIFQWSSC